MAITWVHNNIASFGGDPTRVTVFGESAGSASTIFQALYPGNQGLFQRMIAQSGTPTGFWATQPNPEADARKMAELVGCEQESVAGMVSCLRATPQEKLNSSLNDLANWQLRPPLPFVPVVDGDFVQTLPRNILDVSHKTSAHLREQFASYDFMIGLNSGEGASNLNPMFGVLSEPENFLPNRTEFNGKLVPVVVNILYGQDAPAILNDLIIVEYTDNSNPENPDSIRDMFCEMHKDSMFLADTYRAIETHAAMSSNQGSYMYHLNLLPYKSIFPRPSWFTKPLHADDLLYVFGNSIDIEIPGLCERREFKVWEKVASENIMTLWTNFAQTGNPNKPRDIGVDWLPYTPARHSYLEIYNDVAASKVKERLSERRALLWDSILPSVARLGTCEESLTGTCSKDRC